MRRTWLSVVVAALLLTGLTLWLPPSERPADGRSSARPWEVQVDGHGGSRTFDLELGVTTLTEAERRLGSEAEVTLFQPVTGMLVLEAFFDNLSLGGLQADFVMVLDLPIDELEAIHGRGLRIARGREGVNRVQLDPVDLPAVLTAPITTITYLPSINLDPATLEKRFGPPAQRIAEGPGINHWLYPATGLDIIVNDDGKEVLQYVAPRDFERLAAPLRGDPAER